MVVDTAPTGHTLRLLAAPALLGRVAGVLDALQSHHRAVVGALRGSYRADAADALIAELEREGASRWPRCSAIRAASEVTWVTLPEPMALEETADAIAALESAGIHVGRLIVNRLTPSRRSRGAAKAGQSHAPAAHVAKADARGARRGDGSRRARMTPVARAASAGRPSRAVTRPVTLPDVDREPVRDSAATAR